MIKLHISKIECGGGGSEKEKEIMHCRKHLSGKGIFHKSANEIAQILLVGHKNGGVLSQQQN